MQKRNWIHRTGEGIEVEHRRLIDLYIDIGNRHDLDITGDSAEPFRNQSNMALFRQTLTDNYDWQVMCDDAKVTHDRRIRRADYVAGIEARMGIGRHAPYWRYEGRDRGSARNLIYSNREKGRVYAKLGDKNVTMRTIFETVTTYGQEALDSFGSLGTMGRILQRNDGPAPTRFAAAFRAMQDVGIPWRMEHWWRSGVLPFLLAPRASEKHPGLLCYYQSADKMERDVLTPIKAGRFLGKYFPQLDEDHVRYWSTEWDNANSELVVHFTETTTLSNHAAVEQHWMDIYRHGPHSCMKSSSSVRVYAKPGNSLRLAYITDDGTPGGQPIARCIVRDDEMKWVRIYPEDSGRMWNGMKKKLEALGYTHGGFEGIEIQRIRSGNGYVCPYIDCGYDGPQMVSVEDDCLLITEDGEWDAATTGGHIGKCMCCDNCGDGVDSDDVYYSDGDTPYCEFCYNDLFCQAYSHRGRQCECRQEDCVQVDGEWYHIDYLSYNSIHECDNCGEYFKSDDMVGVLDGLACVDCAVALDVKDRYGNHHALLYDTVDTDDGRTIREDESVEIEWADGDTYVLHKDDDPLEYLPEVDDPDDTARVNIDAEQGEEYEHATA